MGVTRGNGADIYYEEHGRGFPLILIAGYACDHTFWTPVLEDFAAHFRTVVFDNRGVGQTRDDGAALTAELMAGDVAALAAALGIQKAHVVGHSMGGTIAQSVAALSPSLVERLGILSSTARWRRAMLLGFGTIVEMRAQNVALDTQIDMALAWVYGDAFLSDPHAVEAFRTAVKTNPYPQSLPDQRRQYGALQSWNGTTQLANIKCPTLVGFGLQDRVALPADGEFLATTIEGARVARFNTGHGLIAEMPQSVTNALLHFLNQGND